MGNKNFRSLTMVLFVGLILVGCWDSGNIEQQNNVSLVIVDFNEEQYSFYIELANVLGGNLRDDQGGGGYSILHASGPSLIDARDQLNRRSDYPVFLGATRAVVFTQRMADKGIEEYINRIRREYDYRKSVVLLTSPTEPFLLISDETENDRSVGDAIEHTLENQKNEGQTVVVTVGDVLQIIALENVGFLLPQISSEEEENTLTGYTVFKDAKRIGTIPAEERKGIAYFLCSNPAFYYETKDENNHFIFNVVMVKKNIKPLYKDNQITFEIDMSFECELLYMNKITTITKEQQKHLSEELTKMIEDDVISAIKDSQRTYRTDYLGFYKYFRAKFLKEFKEMNWEEKYTQAEIKVKVKAKIEGGQGVDFNEKEE